MTVAGKVAATILGAGGTALIGCYAGGLIKTGGSSTNAETPEVIAWSPLSKDTNFSDTYGDGTTGKEYGRYLTGVDAANQKWWEKTHKQYETNKSNSTLSEHFGDGKVTDAYSTTEETNNTKSLNKVCAEAYKKTLSSDVDFESTVTTEEKYKLAVDILKYCSPLGKTPEIISNKNNSYAEGKIGKQGETNKLVSVTNEANDDFWSAHNEWFKEQGSAQLGNYFNKFFSEVDSVKKLNENKTIKEICKEAYDQTAPESGDSTANNPTVADVAKYCSFKKVTAN